MRVTKTTHGAYPVVTSPAAAVARAAHRAPGVLTPSAVLIASALGALPIAHIAAQERTNGNAQQAEEVEEVVVTGSRIRRQDFSANSPITTITSDTFEETSTVGIETVLNQLPQFVPSATNNQFVTGDVQNGADRSVGASVVSLRGLGANRNLVLIDGRRGQPINGALVVDTNSIPSAAIERVEVISGGASAVYGADAVGGVVNFILKNDFEGATIDARYGETELGDNEQLTISGLFGTSFDGGRGNVMVGLEHSSRGKVRSVDRDWELEDLAHPNHASGQSWFSETFVQSASLGNNPSAAAIADIFPAATATIPANTAWYINPTPDGTGTVFTGADSIRGPASAAGAYKYDGPWERPDYPGLPYRKVLADGEVAENALDRWASIPLDRYSFFGRARYDLSDSVRATVQGSFATTRTETLLGFAGSAVGANNAIVPHGSEIYHGNDYIPDSVLPDGTTNSAYLPGGRFGLSCPAVGGCTESQAFPLPAELEYLLDSRRNPDDDITINRQLDFMGYRRTKNDTTTYQLVFGLEGEVFNGAAWDVSYATGQTLALSNFEGFAARERWRELVASPNFGVGFQRQGNAQGAGFAGGIATCTTGLPIVRDFTPSEDCVKAMQANLQNNSRLNQSVFETNLTGTAAQMPAGALQYAVGLSQREEKYIFHTDDYTMNESWTENGLGLFPTNNTEGSFDVKELYGELLVPLVRNVKGAEHLNLELGGRVSDYSTVGKVDTSKALIDWGITSWARIRGGVNRANRAPNLTELFLTRTQRFGGAGSIFGDQCSQNNQEGPYSANPNANINGSEGAAFTKAICEQLMGQTGADQYYGQPVEDQPSIGGVGLPNTTGNPNLESEEADTFTLGIVFAPKFDVPFVRAMTLSLDYYEIEIRDMIAVEDADSVFQRCLDPALNTTGDATAPACGALLRDPQTGAAASIDLSYTNEGRAVTSGVDLQLNWSTRLERVGGLRLNVLANYNIENSTQAGEGLTTIDWVGTQGCDLGLDCMGYDYRIFSTLNWFKGPFSASLRWQHWPSIKSGAFARNPDTSIPGVGESYDLFALSGSYQLGDKYVLRFGIENLLDKEPPLSGGNPDATAFPVAPSHAGGGTYDPLGRRYFVNATMRF